MSPPRTPLNSEECLDPKKPIVNDYNSKVGDVSPRLDATASKCQGGASECNKKREIRGKNKEYI